MSRYEMQIADEWERRDEDEYEPDEVEAADLAWKQAREDALWEDAHEPPC